MSRFSFFKAFFVVKTKKIEMGWYPRALGFVEIVVEIVEIVEIVVEYLEI
jgi:hypothetical protein